MNTSFMVKKHKKAWKYRENTEMAIIKSPYKVPNRSAYRDKAAGINIYGIGHFNGIVVTLFELFYAPAGTEIGTKWHVRKKIEFAWILIFPLCCLNSDNIKLFLKPNITLQYPKPPKYNPILFKFLEMGKVIS